MTWMDMALSVTVRPSERTIGREAKLDFAGPVRSRDEIAKARVTSLRILELT
jgi:hypothetical protein